MDNLLQVTLALVVNCFPSCLAGQTSCHSMKGKSNSRLHKLGERRGEEYWHELLTQGFLRLFGSSSVFSHDWSMVSKGNYKYSHSLL